LVDVTIQEKAVRKPATAPSLLNDGLDGRLDTTHLTLEGHVSTFGSRRQRRHDGDFDDIESMSSDDDREDGE